ncbi:leucine-rich repeat and fibronectin type-III domain-containing protein 2-like, partial [Salvelinus namaycush]|uniref:Leucine-rich repeat and fibronectin type-III domain-containing protein 2-like n=1 Tax=Salvelinus namaycush TaxID=8040 RepID=A0A8U0U3J9_SALNM
ILPSTSDSFMLKNLVSGTDYNLCVLAIFDDKVTSLAATKVLGCAQFSTKELYPECRSLQTHFLGGTLTILVGGVVVVTLLVFTVALMVRHRVCSNQDDHCHHGDDSDELACCQGGSLGSPVKEAAAGGGGGVYGQSDGNGDVMMVVLPNGLPSKQRGGRTKERGKEKKKDKEKGNEGEKGGADVPPKVPPKPKPQTLPRPTPPPQPSPANHEAYQSPGAPLRPSHSIVRAKRSNSLDMGLSSSSVSIAETTVTTQRQYGSRHGYAKRLSVTWTRRSKSLQGMLVGTLSNNQRPG